MASFGERIVGHTFTATEREVYLACLAGGCSRIVACKAMLGEVPAQDVISHNCQLCLRPVGTKGTCCKDCCAGVGHTDWCNKRLRDMAMIAVAPELEAADERPAADEHPDASACVRVVQK